MTTAELILVALLNPVTIGAAAWITAGATRWLVGRRLTDRWGNVAAVMPGLPAREHKDGEAGKRFDEAVTKLVPKVLRRLRDEPSGVHAAAIATATNAPPEVAAAVLEAIADHAPHELRVTRSGKLLYDFEKAGLQRAEKLLKRPLFGKIAGVAVLALANIGTAWPMLATLGVAAVAVYLGAGGAWEWWLAGALLVMGCLAIATLLLSTVAGWLGAPDDQPEFAGPVPDADGSPLDDPSQEKSLAGVIGGLLGGDKESSKPSRRKTKGKSSSWFDGGDIADAIISGLSEIRDIRFVVVAVIVVLFLAAVGGTFLTLISWLLGLWRSLGDRKLALSDIAPGRWVRQGKRPSGISAIAPTTDIAGRAVRALGLALTGSRPGDDGLRARIHNAAAQAGGRISALDIALSEGLELEEAISVGTRVAIEAGGALDVSDEGDVLFALQPSPQQGVPDRALSELLRLDAPSEALTDGVPVNVVGLTDQHLKAIDRLAGGALFMVLSSPLLIGALVGEWDVAPGALVPLAAVLLPVSMAS